MTCGRKIGPFDCCSVVQGDCLELMKQLPDGCVDAVITDPPYGINLDATYSSKSISNPAKGMMPSRGYPPVIGDDREYDPTPLFIHFRNVKEQFWFGADNYRRYLPDGGSWIAWDKREGLEDVKWATSEFELCWSKSSHLRRLIRFRWFGLCGTETQDVRERVHPTQKPWQVMAELIKMAGGGLVIDPYCGSGSTLIAAKKLEKHFLGFEISPEYCEIARKRIALVEAQPNLFQPKAEQLQLGDKP